MATSLTATEVRRAVTSEPQDENALEFLAGYLFKRLMGFHKNSCDKCSVHGSKLASSDKEVPSSQVYILLRRYQGTEASLYRCSQHFKEFVRHIIQIAAYCFQQKREKECLVRKVVCSVLEHLGNLPALCEPLQTRFIALAARTIILNKMRQKNSELRAGRKLKRGRRDAVASKLQKLKHD